jgi:nucleotide-binding universal stress UspA family protein
MFKNILIPISSEFYSKHVLQQSVFLAEKFGSKLNLVYIIEEKTLAQADRMSDAYRTHFEIEETKNEIINKQKQTADNIIFNDAKFFFKNKKIHFEEKIVEGEFSEVIKKEIEKKAYDLILMGFAKGCILNYRLLEEVNIPVWVEGKTEGKSILAICSNLAPNQKVPDVSIKLSKKLGWDLHMLYVIDVEDNVQVDENCIRSDKKPQRDLYFSGQYFVREMKDKGINIELVKGNLEKETAKAADSIKPNLIVVGREQKKKGALGLPVKNVKKKIAEKCEYSILFVN